MDLDPRTNGGLRRLRGAIEHSLDELSGFRKQRRAALERYVGSNYGNMVKTLEGSGLPVSGLNLSEMAIQIFLRNLVARCPRSWITTEHRILKSQALDLEVVVDDELERVRVGDSMKEVVLSALLGIGCMKVGLELDDTVSKIPREIDVTRVYAECVDLDDLLIDMSAKRRSDCRFFGDRIRIPLSAVRANPMYDPSVVADLVPSELRRYDTSGSETVLTLGAKSPTSDEAEFEDHVDLLRIFMRKEQMLLVFADDGKSDPLMVEEWYGPETGPYKFLAFEDVPGRPMPLAPESIWRAMSDWADSLMSKVVDQGLRAKSIGLFRAAAKNDAERILRCVDGDLIKAEDPHGFVQATFGGVDQPTLAFMLQLRDLFSYRNGNLDLIGGMGASSPTATQDELLQGAGNRRLQEMQDRVYDFAAEVVRDIAWYVWTDPLRKWQLSRRLPGTELKVPVKFSAETRKGMFLDHNFKIRPYSMQRRSPQEELAMINQLIIQAMPVLGPALQAQNASFNAMGYVDLVGRLANIDSLNELVIPMDPSGITPGPGPSNSDASLDESEQAMARPAITERRYVRINRPGTSQRAKENAILQQAMANRRPGVQASENAATLRSG